MNSNLKAIAAEHPLSIGRTLTSREKSRGPANGSFETSLEIPSYTGFVTPVVERVVRKLHKAHCIPGKESDVRTALYEAVANAVIHGNREDVKKQVHIWCRYDARECVLISVSDEGDGFDPKAVPDPTRPENLESEHGRGIFLMKTYMDEVRYEKGGTEVHLMKKCVNPVHSLVRNYASKLSHYFHSHSPRIGK
ncbi:MAG: ATP-binding protein [Candidatus Acidiferrales bacterium]